MWYKYWEGKKDIDLEPLLNKAWDGYKQHTEWHHKHLNNSIIRLSAIIVAELTVIKMEDFDFLNLAILLVFSIISIFVAKIGLKNSKISFEKSMEYIILFNKVLYAMGYGVAEPNKSINNLAPASDDECLIPQKLIGDWTKKSTTFKSFKGDDKTKECTSSNFVDYHTKIKRGGVSKHTSLFIYVMASASVIIGLLPILKALLKF